MKQCLMVNYEWKYDTLIEINWIVHIYGNKKKIINQKDKNIKIMYVMWD